VSELELESRLLAPNLLENKRIEFEADN
jgi:hypothetical protein